MQFLAILDVRHEHWYASVPALACGSPVPEISGAEAVVAALITAATGLPSQDFSIAVQRVGASATTVPSPPLDVEVLHKDGAWRGARQSGWMRGRDGSWRALVCYVAAGVTWERAVPATSVRFPGVSGPRVPGWQRGVAATVVV